MFESLALKTSFRVHKTWIGLIRRGEGLLMSLGSLWFEKFGVGAFGAGFQLPLLKGWLWFGVLGNSHLKGGFFLCC